MTRIVRVPEDVHSLVRAAAFAENVPMGEILRRAVALLAERDRPKPPRRKRA